MGPRPDVLDADRIDAGACGGGDGAGDAASGSSGEVREVTVGMPPILPTVADGLLTKDADGDGLLPEE